MCKTVADYTSLKKMLFSYIMRRVKKVIFTLAVLLLATACSNDASIYLIDGMGELAEDQKQWVQALRKSTSPENKFTAINNITQNLKRKDKTKSLIKFLTAEVDKDMENPYNAYWLLMVANEYLQTGQKPIAEYYLERIVKLYPDMEIRDQSLHYLCLQNLVKISTNDEQLISYYTLLLQTLYDKINPARAYFALGQAYERQGEWKLAIQAYNDFVKLGQYDIIVEGIPNTYMYAKRIIDYANSSKNWTFVILDDLVQTVRTAVRQLDYTTLERCMTKVNFTAMPWNQEPSNISSQANFNLRTLMYGGYIKVSNNLAPFSTNNEVYLKTSGWSQYTHVWYLYFKRVNFPADPEIHGNWEWAGIYYGEKK